MKTYYLFLSIFFPLICISVYSESYNLYKKHDHLVGDINVWSKSETRSSGRTSYQVTETLQEIVSHAGHRSETWKAVQTSDTFPPTTTTFLEGRDKYGTYLRFLADTDEFLGVGLFKVFEKPLGNEFEIGDQVFDEVAFFSVNIEFNGYIYTGYGTRNTTSYLKSVENASTPWGTYLAMVISGTSEGEITIYNGELEETITFTQTSSGSIKYVNGLGVIFSSSVVNRDLSNNYGLRDNDQFTEERVLLSSTANASPTNIIPLTQQQVIELPLKGWTYQGDYPWIYSNETRNWYYQVFQGSNQMLYDVNHGQWIKIDGSGTTTKVR